MAQFNRVLNGESTYGPNRQRFLDMPGPASYTTGGISILPGDVGMKTLLMIDGGSGSPGSGPYTPYYDLQNQKLQFFNGGSEVSAGTNLSTYLFRLQIIGY